MLKFTIMGGLLLSVAACAQIPEPLCDREAQEWNKFETQEDQCARTATERAPTAPLVIKRSPPTTNPETPVSGPEDEPGGTEEDGATKPKSDNSDANGKGGNRHDREDKTHGGTETAEEKK